MASKIDGTNGLLQNYVYLDGTTTPSISTGFSYTVPSGIQNVILNPASTFAAGTVILPASPVDGMTVTISTTQQITSFTVSGSAGQYIGATISSMPAKGCVTYLYNLSKSTWYPTNGSIPSIQSTLVNGTSLAYNWNGLTTNTVLDFIGLPSWAKRFTVMLNGLSTSSTSCVIAQLGTGSGPTYTTTGYVSGSNSITTTLGLIAHGGGSAADLRLGSCVISNFSGNIWNSSCVGGFAQGAGMAGGGGYISLSGVPTAIRITTTGSDTFDAGSVNLQWE